MFSLVKILSSQISRFFSEKSTHKGLAYKLQGGANHLQVLPWCLQGGAGIPAGHASVPAGEPQKPSNVPHYFKSTPCNNTTTTYNTAIVLELLRELYMLSRAIPLHLPTIP